MCRWSVEYDRIQSRVGDCRRKCREALLNAMQSMIEDNRRAAMTEKARAVFLDRDAVLNQAVVRNGCPFLRNL